MSGAARRLAREQDEMAWLAWHIEALSRTKKLPQLKEFLTPAPIAPRRKTAAELEAILRGWLSTRRKRRGELEN